MPEKKNTVGQAAGSLTSARILLLICIVASTGPGGEVIDVDFLFFGFVFFSMFFLMFLFVFFANINVLVFFFGGGGDGSGGLAHRSKYPLVNWKGFLLTKGEVGKKNSHQAPLQARIS